MGLASSANPLTVTRASAGSARRTIGTTSTSSTTVSANQITLAPNSGTAERARTAWIVWLV